MEYEQEEIKVNFKYLNQVLNFCGSSLVGKVMKRFEIVNDKDTLKKEVRELIYEDLRQMKEILVGYAYGKEIKQFTFKLPTSLEKK